jgi:alpha-glucosidase (family GH31 glycosyl hydrolase)
MSRRPWFLPSLLAPILLAPTATTSCSSKETSAPPPPATEVTLSGLKVRIEPEPLRIVVATADGKLLFDGLPPREIAAPNPDLEEDPPALTGLAVRTVETGVQALYGSYQFTDVGTRWRSATRASNVRTRDGAIEFDAQDGGGTIAAVAIRAEGESEIAIAVTPTVQPPEGSRVWTSIAARCDDADRFLGFGAQARDVEHRGTIVPLFVSEPGIGKRDDDAPLPVWYIAGTRHASSYPVPLYLARRGYVGALDGPGRANFGMCAEEDALRITGDSLAAPGGTFLFRIFAGATPKEAIGRSTARFGRPRIPPRLAFAPWHDWILGSDAIRALAKYLRDEDVPSSAIWYEDFRGGRFVGDDYKLSEEWDPDPTLYPDIEGLAKELHDQGFASLLYFNTFVEKDNSVWKEAEPKGFLVKKADGSVYEFPNVKQKQASMVDLTNPAARAWMTGKLKAALALGADGWMGDYGEWLPLDAKLADGSDPFATHNLYPQLWQETQRAALDADDVGGAAPPKDRRLTFVRSGWLRTAPLGDVVWAGDQATDLSLDDGLPTVIPMGLGLSIAGVSTYGSDIAGYQVALRQPSDKETWFRWVEVGAWSPVMRTHHGTQPNKNWQIRTDAESTRHFRRYAILHQQLLPVWEALAKEAHETGITIWRHLATEFPADERAWSVGDQVMVGPSILVAPVTTKGATTRKVWLPAGARWAPFDGGAFVDGGAEIEAQAALAEVPVFVRAGTVLPMLPDRVRTVISEAKGVVRVEDVGDDRELLVVAGPDATARETNGLEYALRGGEGAKAADLGSLRWNGEALPTCAATPTPPCAANGTAYTTGPGTLAFGAATLEIKGGAADRSTRIVLRAP